MKFVHYCPRPWRAAHLTVTDDDSATNSDCTTATLGPPSCVGDCDGDGSVSIDELITGVNISLGLAPLGDCPSFDRDSSGSVSIDELITGVNNALTGCPDL